MVVAGLHDGNIAVYNLQTNTGKPCYQSDAVSGKHRDVVWQVQVQALVRYAIGLVADKVGSR